MRYSTPEIDPYDEDDLDLGRPLCIACECDAAMPDSALCYECEQEDSLFAPEFREVEHG